MTDDRVAVYNFVGEFWPDAEPPPDNADLFDALGIEGDDAFEFIEKFVHQFDIDASNYRWYFHHGEEGINTGGIFIKPPYRRVKRIPITINLLTEAARTRIWPLEYPEHQLPRVRWDIQFNIAFSVLTAVGVLWLILARQS